MMKRLRVWGFFWVCCLLAGAVFAEEAMAVFDSAGYQAAGDVRVTASYPEGWTKMPLVREGKLLALSRRDADVVEMLTLTVADMSEAAFARFRQEEAKKAASREVKAVSFAEVEVDGKPAVVLDRRGGYDRGGMAYFVVETQQTVWHRGKAITQRYAVLGRLESRKAVQERYAAGIKGAAAGFLWSLKFVE